MFASPITDTVTLSNGTDTVVVKKLGWKAQKAAKDEFQRSSMARMASLGPGFIDVQQAIRKSVEANGGLEAMTKAVAADPFVLFDQSMLLERGIVSWSLSAKPTPAEMDELDPVDAEKVARAIHELFRDKTEDERKND
jgi:hypothetical protein